MGRITTNSVAVGFAGAMTDVSSSADLDEGVTFSWGRESEFEDTRPSEFSFTLDNADGKFTPDNTASTLPSPLTEGMLACWQLGSRLVSGRIREIRPVFPDGESAWAQVQLTCDDDLGVAARTDLPESVMESLVVGATPYAYWPHSEAAGSAAAYDQSGEAQPYFAVPRYSLGAQIASFGYTPDSSSSETRSLFVADGLTIQYWSTFNNGTFATPAFGTNEAGVYGFRLTPLVWSLDSSTWFDIRITLANGKSFWFQAGSSSPLRMGAGWSTTSIGSFTTDMVRGVSSYFTVALTISGANLVGSVYQDGVFINTYSTAHGGLTSAAQLKPSLIEMSSGSGTSLNQYVFSDLSYTADRVAGELVPQATVTSALEAAAASVPSVTLTAVPASFSTQATGAVSFSGSALDAMNDAIRTEQGYIYTTTTGTLTAPSQSIVARERVRPSSVSYTFDAELELDGAPDLVRDLTDMVSQVTVNGTTTSRAVKSSGTFTNKQLTERVGSANTSESTLNLNSLDLIAYGEDRLNRGANIQIRVAQLTIDAMTTPTDRSTDLLAMIPGDRIQIINLPNAQLNFTTWDGWLIGATEQHTTEKHTFTLYLQPVQASPGIFDTDVFAAGTSLTLSAGINSSVTSMSVATTDAKFTTSGGDLPLTVLVDSEQITVTACTSATPQVMTITRGANGTTAAAHSSGAQVELVSPAIFGF